MQNYCCVVGAWTKAQDCFFKVILEIWCSEGRCEDDDFALRGTDRHYLLALLGCLGFFYSGLVVIIVYIDP